MNKPKKLNFAWSNTTVTIKDKRPNHNYISLWNSKKAVERKHTILPATCLL